MALKATQLRTLPAGRHPDGRYGLYFNVIGNSRTWIQRLTIDGKRRNRGLGPWPVVSLAEARDIAFENVRLRHRGLDPFAERQRERTVPTFAQATESYVGLQRAGWKAGGRVERNVRGVLLHAKAIADRPIDGITTDDVIGVLGALIRDDKMPTARALRQRLRAIFDWARSKGHRLDNPADERIDAALPRNGHTVEHRKAVSISEVPAVFRSIRAIGKPTWRGMVAATEFLILTGARSAEVTGARWNEIDLATATWTVPASRMKLNRAHRVPLSTAALTVLQAARERHGSTGLVFRAPRGGEIDRLVPVLRHVGIGADIHGFRSSLRDWCSENGVDDTVAERCIAHYETSATRKAYHRTDRYEDRVAVMEAWGAHVAATVKSP